MLTRLRYLCAGFASGDTERDVASIRQFIEDGHNVAVCQSFAKNFGLYGTPPAAFRVLPKHLPLRDMLAPAVSYFCLC